MAQQLQHQKSQERFDALIVEAFSAVAATNARDYREYFVAAEKFLPAVHAAPSVWTKHRFYAFSTFLASIMRNDMNIMTHDHIDAISKDFISNEEEPPHFRALACCWAAIWYAKIGPQYNLNTTAEFLREGLDIIAASPVEDENRQVLYHPCIALHLSAHAQVPNDVTLKGVLRLMEHKIRQLLTMYTNVTTAVTTLAGNQCEQANHARLLLERVYAGGMVCDCCGKTLEELQMTSFKRCSRCELVFYCSPACQREHWKKKGHKQACREKGQIEIGDDMHLATKIERDGRYLFEFVKVISSVGGDQWQVMHYGSENVVTVDGDKLVRLRPPSTL